jgi:hypothetical protein
MWFPKPLIPSALLTEMIDIHAENGYYDQANGGQWRPGRKTETVFQGGLFPVSNYDLQRVPGGTYSVNTMMLYTNGYEMKVGQQFYSITQPEKVYTITQELEYGVYHPLKKYACERKAEAYEK